MSQPHASNGLAADQELARLVEEITARRQGGEPIDVEQYAADHPEYADHLRQLLPALELLAEATRGGLSWSALGPPPADGPVGVLGDFRIVREVGRGGMGVVYEAEQISLGRRVALKVLPFASALDARRRQRFDNEVHAAALLHHTHIVPIFAVGCERGVHFYAMQFIDGHNLAAVVRDLRDRPRAVPQPGEPVPGGSGADVPTSPLGALTTAGSTTSPAFFGAVARLGLQAAEALEHAHDQGVIHRDVKPANLLVDERGHLWVTDFGLARLGTETGLTVTGDLLGTLRYMSPEQAQGRPLGVDHRTDVYSLGAALYELLTLEPVFPADERAELMRQIAEDDPRPPRRVNPCVPVELETIVLKALAKSPFDRYGTAREMADDLRRFLEDKPIKARRSSVRQRLRRWGRRHRAAVVAAAVAAGVILFTVLIGLILSNLAITRARDKAQDAERDRTRQLFDSLLAQGQAIRQSGRLGSRADGLRVLEQAARIAPTVGIADRQRLALRNEVVACLALEDVRVLHEWNGYPPGTRAIAFDPDLHRYARGDDRGAIRILRVSDQHELARLGPQPGANGPWFLRFSPCGRYLAAGHHSSDGPRVVVWDVDRQRVRFTVPGGGRADFTADGRTIAVAVRNDIELWDVDTGKAGRTLKTQLPGSAARGLAFDRRGRWLAVWNQEGREAEVWSVPLGSKLWQFSLPARTDWQGVERQQRIHVLTWHPDQPVVAVGSGGDIYLWALEFGKVLGVLKGHQSGVVGLAYAASGDVLASTSWDGTSRLWDPRSGRQLSVMPTSPTSRVSAVSRDGRRFVVCNGEKLAVVQVAQGPEYRMLDASGPGNGVTVLAIDPTSRLLLEGGLQDLRLWDVRTGTELDRLPVGPISRIEFPDNGREMVTGGVMGVHRWPLETGSAPSIIRIGPPAALPKPGIGRHATAFGRDGRTLVVVDSGQGRAVVTDTATGAETGRLTGQLNISAAEVSPDGRWVATGSQHGEDARVWRAAGGQLVCRVPQPNGTSSRPVFSPDGKWLAIGFGSEYALVEVGTWEVVRRYPRDYAGDLPGPAAFSPDGRVLAVTRTPQLVILLDPDTGDEIATLRVPQSSVLGSLCFSPDGHWLAAAGETIHLWDLRRIRGHLADLGLDWGPTTVPASPPEAAPLRVDSDPGDLAEFPRRIAYYRWFLKTSPDNTTACNNLAWLYVTGPERLRDPKAALALAEKAVRLKPHRDYLNTLGVVYYRLGRYRDAVDAFDRAVQSTEADVPAHDLFFLAMCYHHLGDREKARATYEKALVSMERLPSYEEELRGFRAEAEQLIRP